MKRRTRKQLPVIISLSLGVCSAVAGFSYLAYDASTAVVADAQGCFDQAPGANTVVWVDASPPRWNADQGRTLRNRFDQLYEQLGFNERLSVFTTEGDVISDVPEPRFHLCGQARSAQELESIGAASAQAGYLARQKQRLYEETLAPKLEALLAEQPDSARAQHYQSPVLEQLAALSYRPEVRSGTRLVVIGDLLQNSDSAHFCTVRGDMPPFSIFRQRAAYQQRLQPKSLNGVEVEVLMLQRHGFGVAGSLPYCRDEEEIKTFYRDYFKAAGAQSVRFVRVRQGRS